MNISPTSLQDPSQAPDLQPPPLPNRKRGPARSLWLFLILALTLLYIGPLRSEVRFTDDAGRMPADFEVTLRSGEKEERVTVEKGSLHFLRFRWKEIEVTDPSYLLTSHEVTGGKMEISIERNSIRKLKDAATGLPSVRQKGDPDPRED